MPGGGVHVQHLGLEEYKDEDRKDVVDIYRDSGDEKINKERSHGTGKNPGRLAAEGIPRCLPGRVRHLDRAGVPHRLTTGPMLRCE